jgi:hypothetical protein
MVMTFAVEGVEGLPGSSFEFGMNTAFDLESRLFSMSMDMSDLVAAAPEGEIPPEMADLFSSIEIRSIEDTAYVKFPFFNSILGVETEWMSMAAEDADLAAEGFGANAPTKPAEMLEAFEGFEGATVTELGRETHNGIETTHYAIVVDMEQATELADPADLEDLEQFGALPGGELPIDLWVSDDGLVRKLQMVYAGDGLELSPEQTFESMTITMEVTSYNMPIVVEAPPAGEVTDVSDIAGDMFSGFTG